MRKLITIFIALLIVLPVFGLVGVKPISAAADQSVGKDCATSGNTCKSGLSCVANPHKGVTPAPTIPGTTDQKWNTTSNKVCCDTFWGCPGEEAIKTGTGLGSQDPRQVAAKVINIILGFLGIIAVILILVGGFMWMTAAGNEDKVGTAKKLMTAGVVGLIIVLAAFGIAKFVVNALIGATK